MLKEKRTFRNTINIGRDKLNAWQIDAIQKHLDDTGFIMPATGLWEQIEHKNSNYKLLLL